MTKRKTIRMVRPGYDYDPIQHAVSIVTCGITDPALTKNSLAFKVADQFLAAYFAGKDFYPTPKVRSGKAQRAVKGLHGSRR